LIDNDLKTGESMDEKFGGKEVNKEFVKQGADGVTDEDFVNVVENAEQIEKKFGIGPLKRFYDDFLLLVALVKD